jgi:hypothetical protein
MWGSAKTWFTGDDPWDELEASNQVLNEPSTS